MVDDARAGRPSGLPGFAAGDPAAVLSLVAEDLEWTFLDPSVPDPAPAVCRGRDQLAYWMGRDSGWKLRAELEEVLDGPCRPFPGLAGGARRAGRASGHLGGVAFLYGCVEGCPARHLHDGHARFARHFVGHGLLGLFDVLLGRREHPTVVPVPPVPPGERRDLIDVAAGVTTFVLAGRYFESSTRRRSGSALRSLAALGAKEVTVLDAAGLESRRPVSDLVVGTQFVVRPGEAVATDGEVVSGNCEIDRSAMTGEPVPVEVGPGDSVVGGTVAIGGRLVVRATHVGKDTQLAHMVRLVDEAQSEKADVQRLVDRVSGVFIPAVIVASLLTLGG